MSNTKILVIKNLRSFGRTFLVAILLNLGRILIYLVDEPILLPLFHNSHLLSFIRMLQGLFKALFPVFHKLDGFFWLSAVLHGSCRSVHTSYTIDPWWGGQLFHFGWSVTHGATATSWRCLASPTCYLNHSWSLSYSTHCTTFSAKIPKNRRLFISINGCARPIELALKVLIWCVGKISQ